MRLSNPTNVDKHKSEFSSTQRLKAWGVHLFTMSGVAWAILALLALIDGHVGWMWVWLSVALIVDGLDGTLARRAQVSRVVPWFDGVILDDVVDYLTWTFIPAIFMFLYIPLGPRPLQLVMVVLVAGTSMFCYANKGMKATDNYFVGFPAAWNIVAMYFYILGTGSVFNVVISLFIMVLTVSPLTFVHPMRVRTWMLANILVTVGWLISSGVLLAATVQQWHLGALGVVVSAVWWLCGVYFIAMGIARTFLGRARMERLAGLES